MLPAGQQAGATWFLLVHVGRSKPLLLWSFDRLAHAFEDPTTMRRKPRSPAPLALPMKRHA